MATRINPGDNWQSIINSQPAGTTYTITAGVHRGQQIDPQDGDVFNFEPGAIMNGAKVLSGWAQDSDGWYVTGQTQSIVKIDDISGFIIATDPDYPRAGWAVALFADNVPFHHVGSKNDLGPGKFYFDDSANRVYIGEDPANFNLIELTNVANAIVTSSDNWRINGGTIEKYAPEILKAAIQTSGSSGVTLDGLTVQLCTGSGVIGRTNWLITGCRFINMGQNGLKATGTNCRIEDTEIAYNNWLNVEKNFEAGGSKFFRSDGLVLHNCYVHHNNGKGLWTDIDNINAVIEENLCVYNNRQGIYHEISQDAIIRNNTCMFNAVDAGFELYQSNIEVRSSKNVQVYGNTVVVGPPDSNGDVATGIGVIQDQRGTSQNGQGEWLATNISVTDNDIYYSDNQGFSGGKANYKTTDFYATGNVTWDFNRHHVQAAGNGEHYFWESDMKTFSQWQAEGFDLNGSEDNNFPAGYDAVPAWSGNASATPPGSTTYKNKILGTSGIVRYFAIDEANGTAMTDYGPNADNGVYGSVVLGQAGIGDGLTAGQWTRPASYGSFNTTGFAVDFNPDEYAVAGWFYLSASTIADSNEHHLFRIEGGDMLIFVRKQSNGVLRYFLQGGGGTILFHELTPSAGWMHVGVSRSVTNNSAAAFLDGVRVFTASNNNVATVTSLDRAAIGAYSDNGTLGSTLKAQHVVICGVPKTEPEMFALYDYSTPPPAAPPLAVTPSIDPVLLAYHRRRS